MIREVRKSYINPLKDTFNAFLHSLDVVLQSLPHKEIASCEKQPRGYETLVGRFA